MSIHTQRDILLLGMYVSLVYQMDRTKLMQHFRFSEIVCSCLEILTYVHISNCF